MFLYVRSTISLARARCSATTSQTATTWTSLKPKKSSQVPAALTAHANAGHHDPIVGAERASVQEEAEWSKLRPQLVPERSGV